MASNGIIKRLYCFLLHVCMHACMHACVYACMVHACMVHACMRAYRINAGGLLSGLRGAGEQQRQTQPRVPGDARHAPGALATAGRRLRRAPLLAHRLHLLAQYAR